MKESLEYQKLRAQLRDAEYALRDQREKVAELRRQLPLDTVVEDYVFQEGPRDLFSGDAPVSEVKLSELFEDPQKPLVLLHFMYGKAQTTPCPMCTMWADGYDGALPHIEERVNFAIVIAGEIAPFREYARSRGWKNVRIISSAANTIKTDLEVENAEGGQMPGVSVFIRRDSDGPPVHFYTGHAFRDGQARGMDLLSPVWNFFDLTPLGRGDFFPKLAYEG